MISNKSKSVNIIMLLHLVKTRYTQLGGLRLMREYARLGVLWPMVKAMARNPMSRQSYKNVYAVVLRQEEVLLNKFDSGSWNVF